MPRPFRFALVVLLAFALARPLAFGLAQGQGQPVPPRQRGDAPAVSATELTVRVVSPAAMRALEKELARTGGRIRDRSADGAAVLVEAPGGVEASAYAGAIAEAVPVRFAQPVGIVTASIVPTDPQYGLQWGLPAIDAPSAWDYTWGLAEVVVAVIDSGVDLDHPDLVNRLVPGGWDYVSNDPVPDDVYGHGTGVAGIVVAEQDNGLFGVGTAPGTRVLPIRVLGDGGTGSTFHTAQAVRYATDHGADVINLSLGSPDFDPELQLAVQYALDRDVVIVAAAGNTSTEPIQYPARESGVIAVGAVGPTLAIANFSARGPLLDFVAPGVSVYSTAINGGAGSWTGTSAASPMVAGAAALLLSRNPGATVAEVESALTDTVRDLGATGRDDTYGHGLIQAGAAMAVLPAAPEVMLPVYRFFNAAAGTHFYTPSEEERALVQQRWPHIFTFEGVGYGVSSANGHPLYRFFNTRNGSHFYTASVAERNSVISMLSHVFIYEGPTYRVALVGPDESSVYRFFNRANGSHFFTASSAERDFVATQLPHVYTFEGRAFYRTD